MSTEQKVEKTAHLIAQLKSRKIFDFPIQNSRAITNYYNRRLNHYSTF